jgi:sigma-B regulation protein RsbU (phosphoserine phosphatase)
VRSGGVDLAICDWEMPGRSGLELCRAIRAAELDRYVYVVLITGRAGGDDVVEGIEAGADDFLPKPLRMTELRARIRAGRRVVELEAALAARTAEAERAAATVQRDLDAAAALQRQLVPAAPVLFQGLRAEGALCPAATVAGDLFGVLPLDDEHLALYLLDVSGHGVPAAMLAMAVNRAIASATASPLLDAEGRPYSPARVLAELNERFPTVGGEYLTMVYAVVHAPTGHVRYALAGHPPPIAVRGGEGSRRAERLAGDGLPLGLFGAVRYDEYGADLAPGDTLVLYSDGATECERPSGEAFGPQRFREAVSAEAQTPGASLLQGTLDRLRAWSQGPFADDVSLLTAVRL